MKNNRWLDRVTAGDPTTIIEYEIAQIKSRTRRHKMKQTNLLGVEFNPKPTPVPDKVKCSRFGCVNCLWNSCECKSGSMYKPKEKDSCESYTYYD